MVPLQYVLKIAAKIRWSICSGFWWSIWTGAGGQFRPAWGGQFDRRLHEEQRTNVKGLQKRVKDLEKSLEQANVMIYALNAIIDYAEKDLRVPIRKKRGTK